MPSKRPYVISIAGFDPSAGAGILADIKTFESHKVIGLGVTSCITFQNDQEFLDLEWLDDKEIRSQIKVLAKTYPFKVAKIGLVKNLKSLRKIINTLLRFDPSIKIVFDPVLSASAGYQFHHHIDRDVLTEVLHDIFIITPNWDEVQWLSGLTDPMEGAAFLSRFCSVYLKGGHNTEEPGIDYLFYEGETFKFSSSKKATYAKHGSGCVFSSSLAANLALGQNINEACKNAKIYTLAFLESNNTKLGYHNMSK